jgi:hypothetical protein
LRGALFHKVCGRKSLLWIFKAEASFFRNNYFLETFFLDFFRVEVIGARVLLSHSFRLKKARFAVFGEVRVINALIQ